MFMPDGQLFGITMQCGFPWGRAGEFLSKRECILFFFIGIKVKITLGLRMMYYSKK